jgi:CubicO group peptidase (beta-lactamase class C family)
MRRTYAIASVAFAALPLLAVAMRPALAQDDGQCEQPAMGEEFERVAADAVGMDGVALRATIRDATLHASLSLRVYRHDCLVATSVLDPLTESVANNVWSTTKGVVSLLTGRAVTLGALDVDDPIGRFLPPGLGDDAHRAITIRHLLTESSGLRFNWLPDMQPLMADSVRQVLALPFDHEPGTYFEYAQTTVNLLAYVVEQAVGRDLQDFAQDALFGPLGIDRDSWFWQRDRAGNTHGWANLFMPPLALARLGSLVLHEGRWRGEQLIAADYLREATTGTATNPAYGFLLWRFGVPGTITPSIPERRALDRGFIPAAPRDTIGFVGFQDQLIFVIPSTDTVIVRTGFPPDVSVDLQEALTAKDGKWTHDLFRGVGLSYRDVAYTDPGRYEPSSSARVDLAYWNDVSMLAGSLGLGGTELPPGCSVLMCDARISGLGLADTVADAAGTAYSAVVAAVIPPENR